MSRFPYLGVLGACVVVTLPLEFVIGARVWRSPKRLVRAVLPPWLVLHRLGPRTRGIIPLTGLFRAARRSVGLRGRVQGGGVNERQSRLTRFWGAHYGGVLARELVLLVVMLYAYKYVRFLVNERSEVAFSNARRILQWEHALLLDSEATLQQVVLPHRDLVVGLNRYYVSFHFVGTMVFLVWAFVRSLRDYTKLRNVLVAVTLSGLIMHVAFPLAPPRMMPGFVDTMARFGPNPYHSEGVREFANQYAAMPSLHVGWALIVAYGVIRISRSRFRWLILAHPIMTSTAVVLTANHYWLDGVVAAALVAWAVYLLYRPSELRFPRRLEPSAA